jgi:hypothetical protein
MRAPLPRLRLPQPQRTEPERLIIKRALKNSLQNYRIYIIIN